MLLILAAVYISIPRNIPFELILLSVYLIPFFIAKLYKWGLIFLAIYSIQVLLAYFLLPYVMHGFLLFIVSYLTNGLRILLPSILAGTYAIKTTAISEWIAACKKVHLPRWLLIPIAVMVRFFPTVYEEYQSIRQAMAFRGVGISLLDLMKRPLQTLEFVLIPLLMKAAQVAEELTIASLTKGIGLKEKHTSLIKIEWTIYDLTYSVFVFVPLIYSLKMGGRLF